MESGGSREPYGSIFTSKVRVKDFIVRRILEGEFNSDYNTVRPYTAGQRGIPLIRVDSVDHFPFCSLRVEFR